MDLILAIVQGLQGSFKLHAKYSFYYIISNIYIHYIHI